MRSSLSERLLPAEISPRQVRFNELCRASLRYMVQEAATGIIAADVWVLDHKSNTVSSPMLRRMSSACYVDPGFDCPADCKEAFDKLFDVTNPTEDAQCAPGVSLAGVLFADAVAGGRISWQHLKEMATNPEIPSDCRIIDAAACFGFVAGAAFESQDSRGVICLFARETADLDKLQSGASVAFLNACAAMVGSLVVAKRSSVVLQATHDVSAGARRFKLLRMLSRAAGNFKLAGSPHKAGMEWRCGGFAFSRSFELLQVWLHKAGGTTTSPQAGASWGQAAFAFLGAVVTGVVVVTLNKALVDWTHDPMNTIIVASLGALMTMHFAAFNSPLAQPRNVLGGNLIAALAAMFYEQSVEYVHRMIGLAIEPSCLFVLCPATAIAIMHKLGLTHPPAGAIAITLVTTPSSATWRWVMTPLLAGNVICIGVAVLVNNLSSRRQYPLYW